MDVGCCILHPIRATPHAALLYADSELRAPVRIDGKRFGAATINVTLQGRWRFHGPHGRHVLDPSTVMLGSSRDTYGCAHRAHQREINLIAALRDGALDPDEGAIFDRDTLRGTPLAGMLRRAQAAQDAMRFESLIFEAFAWASNQSLPHSRRGSRIRMQRLKRFIESESHQRLSLEQMALVAGLSPFACVRQFKDATGKTPYAYLLECRLSRARRLLETKNDAIASVAMRSGFPDQAYFSRVFKRATGLTPMQYRRASGGS